VPSARFRNKKIRHGGLTWHLFWKGVRLSRSGKKDAGKNQIWISLRANI